MAIYFDAERTTDATASTRARLSQVRGTLGFCLLHGMPEEAATCRREIAQLEALLVILKGAR